MRWILWILFSSIALMSCSGGDPTAVGAVELGSVDDGNNGDIDPDNQSDFFQHQQYARLTLHSGIHEAKDDQNRTVHKVQLRVVDHHIAPADKGKAQVFIQSVDSPK